VDHNSADVWSFDPAQGDVRFERYLFSQDAGRPAVHKGLLYWPHEDMRIGVGHGVVSVTNGEGWRNLFVAAGDRMMHSHAVTEWRGKLVVAMAGWNSTLASSDDAGRSWDVLVNDPPPTGSFHRYNDVAALSDRLFVRHWRDGGMALTEYRDGAVTPVAGWPQDRFFSRFTRFGDSLYALVDGDDGGTELWRVGQGDPERIEIDAGALTMQNLVSDGEALWIVARTDEGGRLWRSTDGARFIAGDRFSGGLAYSAVALGPGRIYIGGEGLDGKAILWGPRGGVAVAPAEQAELPHQRPEAAERFDAVREARRLRQVLRAPESYSDHGRPLAEAMRAALDANPPPDFFASLLDVRVPARQVAVFGGQDSVQARDLAAWHLFAAMAQHHVAAVPPRYLSAPWERQPNRPQKWFDPLLTALHAVHLSGQNDRATIDALIGRLHRTDDPDWLRSQVTGTLTAITGQSFAYNHQAWKDWWAEARTDWS